MSYAAQAMSDHAKQRAKKRGLECDLTPARVKTLCVENCPVLGIPIVYGQPKITPNSPTLDRIDTRLGYIWDNVQVISNRANTLKNDASLEELLLLAEWVKRNAKRRIRDRTKLGG